MKKLISSLLSIIMFSSTITSVLAADKNDNANSVLCSDWAIESVEKAKDLNIIKEQYNFPENITRERFCELICNYYDIAVKEEKTIDTENKFKDTDNADIVMLNSLGIVSGKSETEFAPNDFLTREEAATILFRLINTLHPDRESNKSYSDYEDSTQISDWAFTAIFHITEMGIMQGVEDNKFAPKDNYTIEQAVATLVRIYCNFDCEEFKNAENMLYSDIERLQNSVNEGHSPWRIDYKEVAKAYLMSRGENVEKGEFVSVSENANNCVVDFKIDNKIYKMELFKPFDKTVYGIWIVKSFEKSDIIGGADSETNIVVKD